MAQIQICRTCLEVIQKPSTFVTLNGSTAKSKEIVSKLEACVPQMTIDAVLNPVICSRCLISLNAAYEFKRKCIAAEEEIHIYRFDAEVDVVDLQLIAMQCSADNSYELEKYTNKENIREDKQSVICKTENNRISFTVAKKEEYEDAFAFATAKDEVMDSDFEAIDDMLFLNDSKEFSTFSTTELQIPYPSQAEDVCTPEIENHLASLPICQVVLTRLSDDLTKNLLSTTNIDINTNLNNARTHSKNSSEIKKKSRTKKRSKYKFHDCAYCEFRTDSAIVFKKHMNFHPGFKMHKCSECEYSTNGSRDLKYHELTHTNTEIYECASCKYKTSCKRILGYHVGVHLRIRPHKCNKCEFSSSYAGSLRTHLKKHVM